MGGILKRVLSGAAAAGAICACTGVVVVAAAFAVYALLKEWVGAPGAAGIVALVFAVIAGVAALVALRGTKSPGASGKPAKPRRGEPPPEASPLERILDIARERPLLAAGAAVAAGLMALRNPLIVTTLLSTLAQPRRPKP